MRIIVLELYKFSYLVLLGGTKVHLEKFLSGVDFYFYLTFWLVSFRNQGEISENTKWKMSHVAEKLRKRHDLNMPGSRGSAESFQLYVLASFSSVFLFVNLILGEISLHLAAQLLI